MDICDDPFSGRPGSYFSLVILTAVGWLTLIFMPILIDGYVTGFKFSETSAGILTAVEVGSLALVAFFVGGSVHRMNKRLVCQSGALMVVIGSVASWLVGDIISMTFARVWTGAGLGLIVAATNALPALSQRAELLYSLSQVGIGLLGSILIYAAPPILSIYGAHGVFGIEGCVALIGFACAIWLPSGVMQHSQQARTRIPFSIDVVFALSATLIFYTVQTAIWAFAERVGSNIGLPSAFIDRYLAYSAILGIGGALTAVFLSLRAGLLIPLSLGFLTQATFGVVLYTGSSKASFISGVLLVTFSSVFVTPYILALLAKLDGFGRLAALGGALINLGATLGPVLAAFASARGGYPAVGYGSAVLLLVGVPLILFPAIRLKSGAPAVALET